MKNTVTSSYNQEWQKKLNEKGRLSSQERVHFALSMLFKDILREDFKGSVLDLGCGDGALVQVLNEKENITAKGIDICQGVNFETDKLPYENNEFDIIIMYSVIEHLFDPGNILTEIKRILKPGGKVVVITSNYNLECLLTCDRAFHNDPTHVHPYNYVSIEKLMKLYKLKKRFIGLWTIRKTSALWKKPMKWQFIIGALLPFSGQAKFAPEILKGKSKTMLCVFENE